MKYLIYFLTATVLSASSPDSFNLVKGIFETKCLKCHSSANALANGGLNMETLAGMKKGGNVWKAGLKPGNSQASPVYLLTALPPGTRDKTKIMPPSPRSPLSQKEQGVIKKWIDEGAPWPKGEKLKYRLAEREVLLPSEVYKKLKFDGGIVQEFKSYTNVLEGSKIDYSMVPITGGKFKRGWEQDKQSQPVREIEVSDFWMGKYEVTWEEYDTFLYRLCEEKSQSHVNISPLVSHPTEPYVDMTFGMGKKKRPVICTTQLAAKAYCMWLSAKTGHFYRLPTEAEWEYAAKAGTNSRFYWGDDPGKHTEYEWFYENAHESYKEIGSLMPNPFGLYDMLGNVSEWCLDSYKDDFYATSPLLNPISLPLKGKSLNNPMEATWPFKIYGRIVRGGNYKDDPTDVFVSRRILSTKEWKQLDPQLPKSVWWMTDSTHVGFRLVRPKVIPPMEDLYKYWPTDEEIKVVPKR